MHEQRPFNSTDFGFGRGSGRHTRAHHADFRRHGFPHHPFGPMGGAFGFGHGRTRRGGVRIAILRLLAEQPMHGYQIIGELSERSGGVWNPSAGSVYPTLQMLSDEGLVTSEETDGKKIFSLTEAGRAEASKFAEQTAPWAEAAGSDTGLGDYREAAGKLVAAAFQIGKNGTKAQREAAVEVLNDARRKLYAILAED